MGFLDWVCGLIMFAVASIATDQGLKIKDNGDWWGDTTYTYSVYSPPDIDTLRTFKIN
jgi:hypothetical protein